MRILGIDPGLRATGYAVVEGSFHGGLWLLAHGIIQTDDAASLERRLHQIHEVLGVLISEAQPAGVALEDLYSAQRFPRTAIVMGHVRGVVCLAAAQRALEVEALPPAAVKQAITGYGAASKAQIQHAVARLFRLAEKLDSHESDAAAMALTALSRRGIPLLPEIREAAR